MRGNTTRCERRIKFFLRNYLQKKYRFLYKKISFSSEQLLKTKRAILGVLMRQFEAYSTQPIHQ